MIERTDVEWIESLKSSNSVAISDLRAVLVRGLLSTLRGKADSNLIEDFAQDTVLKVLASIQTYRGEGKLLTWALAIGMRVAYSELRRSRYKDVSLEAIEAAGRSVTETVVARQASMDASEQKTIHTKLRELIATILTPRQREAILAELDGIPQVVIADRLGTNRNALYKLGHDARVKLKQGLIDAGVSADDVRELIAGAS
jgi:RNA polymerase sigma-70 factor, ECF subfamily